MMRESLTSSTCWTSFLEALFDFFELLLFDWFANIGLKDVLFKFNIIIEN
jgi:hypothetical protein